LLEWLVEKLLAFAALAVVGMAHAVTALEGQQKPQFGDFDAMLERRVVRVLVPYSRTLYFNDKGRQRGLTADALRDFETFLNKKYPKKAQPIVVAAIPTTNDALVLDRGQATATIVRPTVDRDQKVTLRTLPHVNILSMDPTGRYAVAWFDLVQAIRDAGSLAAVLGEIGDFQAVTVISLSMGVEKSVDLAVGLRPREIEFSVGERLRTLRGTVRVDSAPGEGTTIEVRVPAASIAAAGSEAESEAAVARKLGAA